MTDGPTTMNGPLHTPNVTVEDRMISATFATPAQAEAVKGQLVAAGIATGSIAILAHAATSPAAQAATEPSDQGLVGRIREAILPEDSERQQRDAVASDDAVMEVRPGADHAETVIRIIEANSPKRFDSDLERWRNAN